MKYLLLAYTGQTARELGPEEDAAMERHIVSWVQEMTDRGVRLFGSRLHPDDYATTLLECASPEEAIEVASRHPGARTGTIELRPLP